MRLAAELVLESVQREADAYTTVMRRPAGLLASLRHGGWILWGSGLCWAVMFTNFMIALTSSKRSALSTTMSRDFDSSFSKKHFKAC